MMRKVTPREIIKEVPDIQTVILPTQWFDKLRDDRSVFTSLYEWMLKNEQIPSDNKESLHNRTYVSEKIYKKLVVAEKKRLKKKLKIIGDKLERAAEWSDINSGPITEIGGCIISGDVILVIPESSRQALSEFGIKIHIKERETAIKKIRANAAGATFYLWLLPQVERPDHIGDIARDAAVDNGYPRESNQYEEIKSYLESQGACSAAIDSLKDEWLEYLQQYPERVQQNAWCSECGERLNVEDALLVWRSKSQELLVLDDECFENYRQLSTIASRPLSDITYDELHKMVGKGEISELEAMYLIERLTLWGIMPVTMKNGPRSGNRSISNSKRYEVLRRDNFQCVLCGASGIEANLEVDHIIPVLRGGTDDKGNLRCLCFKCNRGKHSKME